MHAFPVYFSLFLLVFGMWRDLQWRFELQGVRTRHITPKPCPVHMPCEAPAREEVDVVMFVPSPIPWEDRRALVTRQFLRERWNRSQVVLLYVLGTRTGARLETDLDTGSVHRAPGVDYLFSGCRDHGDEFGNANGTSGTTCKVYEACVHIAKTFKTKYVWRGADDTYVNLKLFVYDMMAFLPRTRLHMGFYRRADDVQQDLLLSRTPAVQRMLSLYQYGGYFSGSGYLFSGDVAEFIGTLRIPPHQLWCEDLIVSFWLNPFQIQKIHVPDLPGYTIGGFNDGMDPTKKIVHVHYMKPPWWDQIDDNGVIHFS